ncbi:hypothetical protein TRFO_01891 [Tritrichomonas foetus]|uniref:Anaphase-promoting complex subunit 4-like WD40 domain-containing protein n=1 Tax=Tritrichomonas foetus TaxID=1144522 RepID=A0A1J4JMP8_9EUKA|nr:hypothetical protein TRFO_01891 [Tritrichomonas foetus]|eukprot:OHS98821.1 hypothetical protein TRFO_01891 [Tritrichomonas foetus]
MPPRLLQSQTNTAHTEPVRCMSIGPHSGRVFASGGNDRMLYLWAITDEDPILQFGPFSAPISCCSFSPDEDYIAFGTDNGYVSVIDLDSGHTLNGWMVEDTAITCITIHPHILDCVAVGDIDGNIYLFAGEPRSPIQVYNAHEGEVLSVQICPQGNLLATSGVDHLIRIFDIQKGEIFGTIHPTKKFDSPILCLDFHPSEKILAACAEDRSVKIYDINRVVEMKGGFVIGTQSPQRICFAPDGECVASCSSVTLSLFKTKEADHMDHMKVSLKNIRDLRVFDKGIAIAVSEECNVSLILAKTEDFVLMKRKKKKKKKRTPSPELLLYQVQPKKKVIIEPLPPLRPQPIVNQQPASNEPLFRAFREERGDFMAIITQRTSKYRKICDAIRDRGLKDACVNVATSSDSSVEMISVLLQKLDSINPENASAVVEVIYIGVQIDEDLALRLLRLILQKLTPVFRSAADNPQQKYFKDASEFKTACRGLVVLFNKHMENRTPGSSMMRRLMTEYKSFFI